MVQVYLQQCTTPHKKWINHHDRPKSLFGVPAYSIFSSDTVLGKNIEYNRRIYNSLSLQSRTMRKR